MALIRVRINVGLIHCHNLEVLANEGTSVLRTVLLMMFLGLRKLGNICCGHKMFLNKIGNIFCVPATNVARAGKRGNICVGNNVSATIGAFTRHSFWVRHSKILALGPIGLGTVRSIYTAKYVRVFSMLISGTAPLKQERHS